MNGERTRKYLRLLYGTKYIQGLKTSKRLGKTKHMLYLCMVIQTDKRGKCIKKDHIPPWENHGHDPMIMIIWPTYTNSMLITMKCCDVGSHSYQGILDTTLYVDYITNKIYHHIIIEICLHFHNDSTHY
jgi:hypothetical protein